MTTPPASMSAGNGFPCRARLARLALLSQDMSVGKSGLGARSARVWVVLVALGACTDPVERPTPTPVSASIDADSIVRMNTVRVEITLEAQNKKDTGGQSKTWDSFVQKVFTPDPQVDQDWPWRYTLKPAESTYDVYNFLAIARDARGAVVGRAQAVRNRSQLDHSGLRLHFDTACYRPAQPCEDGFTCAAGTCVDAAAVSSSAAADGGPGPTDMQGPTEVAKGPPDGVATEGEPCIDGNRACPEHGSRSRLLCENGSWKAQSECLENERCNSMEGADRGTCQPISGACMNRQANVPYCDGETMKVCTDLIAPEDRACAEHERCVPDGATVRCACRPGYVVVMQGGRCALASQCETASGGCDLLTQCSLENGQRVCSACPPGFSGTGEQGCAPLLQDLTLSAGKLQPDVSPNVLEYRARVPLLAHRVVLKPVLPAKTQVTLNGAPLPENGTWTSPVLPLGETPIELAATSEFGVSTKYKIVLERLGEQQSYLKAPNPGSYNQFGSSVAVSGDTLLVTAWFESSGATGVDGDPNNTGAAQSGAAYVFVRDGDGWKQQAYLKPNDTTAADFFGTSAVLNGDTIVIGAIHEGLFEESSGPSRPGAAYVFTRNAGVWSQTQRLAGAAQDGSDLFGAAVALDADTLAIGAPWESTGGNQAGAVYVYQRNGSMFSEVQKLKSSKPTANARFGWSAALDGDHLVVGAPDDPPPNARTGTAEVFDRRSGMWTPSQFLQPPTLGAAANFGYAVAVRGNRVAISAPRTAAFPGSLTPTEPGEVYVFEAEREGWKQTARLVAPFPRNTDWFGLSLGITDTALIIGAPGDASSGHGLAADPSRSDATFSGAAYLFASTDAGWTQSTFIKPDNADGDDWFGTSLATDGQSLVIGAQFENGTGTAANITSGAVYVFR
jgi:hypothetical protein